MLTERQLLILKEIISTYTETGSPIGSKALIDLLPMRVSSATIRNEMMHLEELGLLEKTHLSSGRIPSIAGYRYYVDHIVKPGAINPNDLAIIQASLGQNFYQMDEIVAQSAKILSHLTSYTAITLGPEVEENRLKGFRMVPLGNNQVMAILVTDNGNVQNQVFNIPSTVQSEELEKVIRLINDQLIGLPLVEVYHRLQSEIPTMISHYMTTPDGFLNLFGNILQQAAKERFYVGGKANLLDFSTIEDIQSLKTIYRLMDGKEGLADLLTLPSQDAKIKIQIGSELPAELLSKYSLITATYDAGVHGKGLIALLGPTSMQYSRMIGLVDVFRTELAKKLTDYYRFDDQ